MFSQLLKLIPRTEFEALVRKHKAEYAAKGLSSWAQFVAMLFCQLGRAHSLREIEGGLKSCEGKLAHLGIEAPARSSLSYANAHRPWQLFEGVFLGLYEKIAASVVGGKRGKFRFKNKLLSIDSTVIDLSVSMYDWAKYQRTKGAIKLHLVLDHDGYLPCFGVLTDGTVGDVKVAQQLRFASGTIVVDDRGYNDYRLFGRWCAEGVFFVTRMKRGARYTVVRQLEFMPKGSVVNDQLVVLDAEGAQDKCPHTLRRVEVVREDKDEVLVFVTNALHLSAATIAAIYKDRWQIELFFKALKQNLKIKTFVGTSANAVHTQIWTALICMLLLRWLQLRSTFGWSLANLVALLRMNLFTHRDLNAWINEPFAAPPDPAASPQADLAFA
jgi:Domain of unknown function (DUF4372)/Transposase DDE domain